MDEQCHPRHGVIIAAEHRGFIGEIEYCDKTDSYSASSTVGTKDGPVRITAGLDKPAKTWWQLREQWQSAVDKFIANQQT